MSDQRYRQPVIEEISLTTMSQREHQPEIGETSSTMSEREHQQENGSIRNWDTEKQSGGQDDPKGASIVKWHAIFIVSFGIAILYVDPLFLYIPMINQDGKCLKLHIKLMITAICLRLLFDMIYVGNIIFGYFSRRNGQTGLAPDDRQPWLIIKRYLRTYFLIDILAILPLPQVLIPITFTQMGPGWNFSNIMKVINFSVLLQYVPRVLRIYLSWKKHIKSSSKLYKGVWIKVAFNIFFYILASHVLGGLWYFFSVQRETTCWHNACANGTIICIPESFNCAGNSTGNYTSLGNYTLLDGACPIKPPNATHFDFGIFQNALESGIVSSTDIPQKLMHCFWWGLRNLSSLGQNLQTSNYFWENCFAVFISIYGLLLLLYFIGNAQTLIQMATEKAANKAKRLDEIEGEMKHIKPKVESWMARNNLPPTMKEPIISCIRHKLEENKDFDMDKLISDHLSKDLVTKIKHHLCLPLLQKAVQNLENQGDQNLLAERICKSLEPKYYDEDSKIIEEGKPITAMVFTTQGSVWCFKKCNGENGDSADLQSINNKFELYGEELLEWSFNHSRSHKKPLPISTKTVKTLSKVELFALTANDLKNLFLMQVPMHTRAAKAKVFGKGVFWPHGKENKNENPSKMSEQNGTSSLLEDGAPKSC